MDKRIIFHIDVNSAFLSWEAVYRLKHKGGTLDLRNIPSAVGGDISQRHGIILAKSIPAKRYGVSTGEPVTDALKKCPDLILVPPNYSLYESSSSAMMSILKEYSPVIEQYSIDEAFADMTGLLHNFASPVAAAENMRNRILNELGFTVNIGVSCNKLLAKMASDFEKPDKVHTLFPYEIEHKMWPLPAQELFFVGKATIKKLNGIGVHTIGDIARMDLSLLKSYFKKNGEILWNYANGIDNSPVLSEPAANKGYGNSTTVPFDVTDAAQAKNILLALCETVGTRLRKDKVQAEVLAVGIKSSDFRHITHQCVLSSATNITQELHETASRLFDECWDNYPIRLLGVHVMRVKEYENIRQLDLFGSDKYEKLEKLDTAVDSIRSKFGIDAVKRAVFLDNRVDHMSGGISREKRHVDYSKLKIH